MSTRLQLSGSQRRLLELSRSHGARTVVVLITAVSELLSLAATGLSCVVRPTSSEFVITAMIIAAVVPLLVAPAASSLVVRLLGALADAHDQLHLLATSDPLTGLANRRRFYELAEGYLDVADQSMVQVAGMIDVDAFKELNDTYGHAAGDAALVALGRRLQLATGTLGVVGRLGGDEFGVCLSVPEAQLPVVTDALEAACRRVEVGPELFIDASLGLRALDGRSTVDAAMRLADDALYEVKRTRRSRSGSRR